MRQVISRKLQAFPPYSVLGHWVYVLRYFRTSSKIFGELLEVVVPWFQVLEEVLKRLIPEVFDFVSDDVGKPIRFSFQVRISCISYPFS